MEPPVIEKQRYRKHGAYYYPDEKVITLPFHAKAIGSYLLVGQVNRVGIFTFSIGLAQEELGLSPKVFNPNFELVLNTLGWKFDRATRVLYVPTWWRYNAPENPNVLIGALGDLSGLPKTPLLNEFETNVRYLPSNLLETFTQRMVKRLAIQHQEQHQEQQQQQKQEDSPMPPQGGQRESRPSKGNGSGSKSEDPVPYALIVAEWNTLPGALHKFEGEPGKNTRRRLKKLWAEHGDIRWFRDYFRRIAGTKELTGWLDSGFCASLTWALEQNNIEKVLGGHYGDPRPLDE